MISLKLLILREVLPSPHTIYIQKKFIQYAQSLENKGCILEIGSGFGDALLPVLINKNVHMFCNDINLMNLATAHNKLAADNRLTALPGSFPYELYKLPRQSFDAILISRVLHFLPGKTVSFSLRFLASLLKSGGKLFIICETPYLKNWQKFLPIYQKRLVKGVKWPGEIKKPYKYENSGRSATLPGLVHWFTKEIIDQRILETNLLDIEQSSYIDRRDQFPPDLLLDGRESIGVIATRNSKDHT